MYTRRDRKFTVSTIRGVLQRYFERERQIVFIPQNHLLLHHQLHLLHSRPRQQGR